MALRVIGLLGAPALLVIFLGTYAIFHSVESAADRTWRAKARVQSAALSNRMAAILENCLTDLAYLSASEAGLKDFLKFMRTRQQHSPGRSRYCELTLLSADFEIFYRIFAVGTRVWMADGVQLADNVSLLSLYQKSLSLKPGEVAVGPISSLEIGHPSDFSDRGKPQFAMLRLITPIINESKTRYLVLSVDLSSIKMNLSDTLAAVTDPESRASYGTYPYCYFFDTSGWVIFQASPTDRTQELTTSSVRVNTSGSLGKPGLRQAFLPALEHTDYWSIVREVGQSRAGVAIRPARETDGASEIFTEYHPLMLPLRADEAPEVIGGLVFMDKIERRRFWTVALGNSGLILGTWAALVLLFYCYLESVRKTALRITAAVGQAEADHFDFTPVRRHACIFETLQQAVANTIVNFKNNKQMLISLMQAVEEYESKIAVGGGDSPAISKSLCDLERIVGDAPSLAGIKDKLLIAASTDLDILIEGETGTGKQLVAEAIHRNSARRSKRFVVVNCAELDENLFLDTFFGHVPGAFTGAESERRGAFLTADGGTLFLDEIQSASLKTQQALLRVIAERKFQPLGSDREITVNVRLIGAANINLRELVADGRFREDLYYRLNVVYLYIPPLRERKNDIAVLVNRFFEECASLSRGAPKQISKGALTKLQAYDWPGNVRELRNCIFSAAALSSRTVLQAEDIIFGGSGFVSSPPAEDGDPLPADRPLRYNPAPPPRDRVCNRRQRRAAAFFLRRDSFTRQEYAQAAGDRVSSRTLNNDLNDLVARGLLSRHYRGPATQYALTEQGRAFFLALAADPE